MNENFSLQSMRAWCGPQGGPEPHRVASLFLCYFLVTKTGFELLCCLGSDGKESARNAGDTDLIPGWGRYPGEGNGNPLQYSCLGNPMDRGAWQATVHRVSPQEGKESDTNE